MTETKEKSGFSPFSSFHIEADRCKPGMRMFISGVIGIGGYSETEILLSAHACRLCISGKHLRLCVYENNTVEVVGRIEGTEFKYGKG